MTPGMLVHEATGRRGEPNISIRGYGGTQIGLYLDGIPMMSIYDRQTDFGQYVMHGIDSIHISKGFTSPVYGMTSLGGAINIVSARPQKELEIGFSQRLIVGRHSSPDETRQSFDIGTNQGKFYVSAGISHTNRSQYPFSSDFTPTAIQNGYDARNSYYQNSTAKLKVGIQPNENHEYSLNFIYQRGKKGGLIEDGPGASGNADYTPSWDWPHYDKTTVYLLGNSYFTPEISLNTRLYYDNFYNQLQQNGCYTKSTGAGPTQRNRPGYCGVGESYYDDDTYGAILTLNWDLAERTNLKFGTNLKYDHHFGYDENGVASEDLKEFVSSEFIQLSQGVWNLRFVLAATYDRADTIKEFTDSGAKAADLGNGNFSLQGVVYYDFAEGNSLHINVGKKQNLPTLKQRYSEIWGRYVSNPNLQIENAINYELGYDLALESTALNVAVFYNDMTNMFVDKTLVSSTNQAEAEAICPAPNVTNSNRYECYQNINADSGYTYGAEIGIEQGFFANDLLVVGANYSYIQKRAKGEALDDYDGADGKKITNYPNHIANAKIAIRPLRSLEFIALGTLESARYYADSGTYERGANYFSVDLSARYEFAPGLNVTVGVTNLTDRNNYAGSPAANFNYLAGRQWFAGFDYKY